MWLSLRISRRGMFAAAVALIAFVLVAAGLLMRPSTVPSLTGAVFATEKLAGGVQLDRGRGFFPVNQPQGSPAPDPIEVDRARTCPAGLQVETAGPNPQALSILPLQGDGNNYLVDVPAEAAGVLIRLTTAGPAISIDHPDQPGRAALLLRSGPERGCTAQWASVRFDLDPTRTVLRDVRAVRVPLSSFASDGAADARLVVWSGQEGTIAEPLVAATHLTFPIELRPGPDTAFVQAAKVMAAALIGLSSLAVMAVLDNRSPAAAAERKPVGGAAILAGAAATANLLFWLVWTWPGIISWDSSVIMEAHLNANHDGWYGWLYAALVSASMALGSIAWLTVLGWLLHIVIIWFVVLHFGRAAKGYGAAAALVAALLFTCIAPASAYVLRDVTSAVLLALAALLTFHLCVSDRRGSGRDLYWTAAYTVVTAGALLIRVDNLVFMIPLLIVFLWRGSPGLKSRVASLAIALTVTFAFPLVAKRTLASLSVAELNQLEVLYGTSPYINGAGAVIASSRFDYGRHADAVAAVHRVIDYGIVAREWRPDYVHYWHAYGRPAAELAEGDVARLRNAFVELALAYPREFLRGRLLTFIGTMGGISAVPLRITKLEAYHPLQNPDRAARLGIAMSSNVPLRYLLDDHGNWSSWPGLAIAIAGVFAALALGAPITFAIACAALVRTAVFFFFEPLDIFFYLYELQFFTFLLPLMLWMEVRTNSRLGARHAFGEVLGAIGRLFGHRKAVPFAALGIVGAAVFVGFGARVLAGPASVSTSIGRDAASLVDFLNILETRVSILTEAGCRLEDLGFENQVYVDNEGRRFHTRDRFRQSSERCQVFGGGGLEARVAPTAAQIALPHPGGLRTGMLEFGLRAVPGVGGGEPDLIALVTHVNPLICAYAARPDAGPHASGRLFYTDWSLHPFDGSAEAAALPFSNEVMGLRQFCFRDKNQVGREGEQQTHLVRVLVAR
jgi:hypothetical protein